MKLRMLAIFVLAAASLASQSTAGNSDTDPDTDAISGMYSFLQEGEFVQINLETNNRVGGFISRFSDDDKVIFLDHFFAQGELKDHQLVFTTKPVHGVWFDFVGKLSRGGGKTPSQDGYYVIRGTLTQYTSDADNLVEAKNRDVTFKSFPRYESEERESPK